MEVKEPAGLTLTCKQNALFLTRTLYIYNKNLHNTGNNTGTTVHNTKVTKIERCAAQSMFIDYNLKRTFLK